MHDDTRRELAQQIRQMTVQGLHSKMVTAGVSRAFILSENGKIRLSHDELLKPLQAFFELSQDFADHEGVFIGREDGIPTLFFAFVHNTRRGLAQGGLRYQRYGSIAELMEDGLRLAQGMTRKNALAGLWWGGGKGILAIVDALDDPIYTDRNKPTPQRRALFEAYGRFIASLNGLYYVAEDIGTTPRDMAAILSQNRFTTCVPPVMGGSGNPSPYTARGVFRAMQAGWKLLTGSDDLAGVKVSVQGAGNVGVSLISDLVGVGAEVWVCDVNAAAVAAVVEQFKGVHPIEPSEIFALPVDIFAPCAVGAQVNAQTIPQLACRLVCGGANNILKEAADADRLAERKIEFVPDFICNRMGIVNCSNEWMGYLPDDIWISAEQVYPDTLMVLRYAKAQGITSFDAAVQLAAEAACETNPQLSHRGRLITDQLIAANWHNADLHKKPIQLFIPSREETRIFAAWQDASPEQGAEVQTMMTAPLSLMERPHLGTVMSALQLDICARATIQAGSAFPIRRVCASGGDALWLDLARENDVSEARLRQMCDSHVQKNADSLRAHLTQLGVMVDDDWIGTADAEATLRLYRIMQESGILTDEYRVNLSPAAATLLELIEAGEFQIRPERLQRAFVNQLKTTITWSIVADNPWGLAIPDGEGNRFSADFCTIAAAMSSAGWPDDFTPISVGFSDVENLLVWVLPCQLLALRLNNKLLFSNLVVHGEAHVIFRQLLTRNVDGSPVSSALPDDERFLLRSTMVPMHRGYANTVESDILVRRFGADALRLGYAMCMWGEERVFLDEDKLQNARNILRRLQEAVGRLMDGTSMSDPDDDERLIAKQQKFARRAIGAYTRADLNVVSVVFEKSVEALENQSAASTETLQQALQIMKDAFSPLCPFILEKIPSDLNGD